MDRQEIVERYSHEKDFSWNFLPNLPRGIDSRSYSFFLAVCRDAVESRYSADEVAKRGGFRARGAPDDCCEEIKREIERWTGDGHSHSWLMVREILDDDKCKGYFERRPQIRGRGVPGPDGSWNSEPTWYPHDNYEWLKEHISDPDNTRMVFFFDN